MEEGRGGEGPPRKRWKQAAAAEGAAAEGGGERDEGGEARPTERPRLWRPEDEELKEEAAPRRCTLLGAARPRDATCCEICGAADAAAVRATREAAGEGLCRSCSRWRRHPRVGGAYNIDPAALPVPRRAE